jgi:hypothetical protein
MEFYQGVQFIPHLHSYYREQGSLEVEDFLLFCVKLVKDSNMKVFLFAYH